MFPRQLDNVLNFQANDMTLGGSSLSSSIGAIDIHSSDPVNHPITINGVVPKQADGAIETGSLGSGGVIATLDQPITATTGWVTGDIGSIALGQYGGNAGAFSITSAVNGEIVTAIITDGGSLYGLNDIVTLVYIGINPIPPSGTMRVATLALPDNTGKGYSLGDYSLSGGSRGVVTVTATTSDGSIRDLTLKSGGENYVANSISNIGTLNGNNPSVLAKYNVTTVSSSGGGGGVAFDTNINHNWNNTGIQTFQGGNATQPSNIVLLNIPSAECIGTTVNGNIERKPPPVLLDPPLGVTDYVNSISASTTFTTELLAIRNDAGISITDSVVANPAKAEIKYDATGGLDIYSGNSNTIQRPIQFHLGTSLTTDDPVLSLSRDVISTLPTPSTKLILESKGVNQSSILDLQVENNYLVPTADHGVIKFTSINPADANRTNICKMRYKPQQLSSTVGTLIVDKEIISETNPFFQIPHTDLNPTSDFSSWLFPLPTVVGTNSGLFGSDGTTALIIDASETAIAQNALVVQTSNFNSGVTYNDNNFISVKRKLDSGNATQLEYDVRIKVQTNAVGGQSGNAIRIGGVTWSGINNGVGGSRILQIPESFRQIMPSDPVDFTANIFGFGGQAANLDWTVPCRMYGDNQSSPFFFLRGGVYFRQSISLTAGLNRVWNVGDAYEGNITFDMSYSTYLNPTTEIVPNDLLI